MRIYLVLADEWAHHPGYACDLIAGCRRQGDEVIGISLVPARIQSLREAVRAIRRDLVFFGAGPYLILGFQQLAARWADRLALRAVSLYRAARWAGIPIRVASDINAQSHLECLRAAAPDVIVSSNGQKFSEALLALPRVACLNRHSSLLPRYRGVWPVFWALQHGDAEVGVSIHLMTSDYDAGDIVAQEALPVGPGESLWTVYGRVFARSAAVTLEALTRLRRVPPVIARRYDPSAASYYSHPTATEARAFRRQRRIV